MWGYNKNCELMTNTTLAPNQRIQNRENYSTVDAKIKKTKTKTHNKFCLNAWKIMTIIYRMKKTQQGPTV